MEKEKSHTSKMRQKLDILESRLNALEAVATDENQRSLLSAVKVMIENQKDIVGEFDHLKKAIDLLTLQMFKMESRNNLKQ